MSAGRAVTGYVAELTGHSAADLPDPEAAGDDWLPVLRQWLARIGFGLVAIADPDRFSWPGHWIALVDDGETAVGVLMFGSPSAVIASPDSSRLVGRSVDELRFHEGLVLVPFHPFSSPATEKSRKGRVAGIYVSGVKTEPMRAVPSAKAVRDRGLEGDRYAAKAGTFTPRSDRLRGYDLTLIASEVLDDVKIPPAESRRNIVTTGIDLDVLVGKEFRIGSVRAFGQRLCEPCVHLQRLTRPGIIADLVHRGGLRADILSDGEIRVGDRITG